jgi:hypothetical protein
MKRVPTIFGLTLLVCVFFLQATSAFEFQPPDGKMVLNNLSNQALSFTENRGQWGDKTLFKAEDGGATFYFCRDEVAYLFVRDTDELEKSDFPEVHDIPDKFDKPRYKKESMVIKAQFIGANPDAEVIGENRLSHNCNYFHGNDPAKWATDVPNFSTIIYRDIWPGIDLRYHGDGVGMKYDFIVNPGADIAQIRIRYDGVNNLDLTSNGDLQADTRFGLIYENIPSIYQEIGSRKTELGGRYIIIEPGVFGFEAENYNPNLPLVIDPELAYSTYLGGNYNEVGHGIAVDGSGNAYVTGYTYSTNFPTQNPYQTDQTNYDVFVTKLSPSGNSLVYSTYLGGDGTDEGYDIAVDDSGNAYITGGTYSTDFPTQNPYQTYQGSAPYYDAFVTKLSSSGDSLIYSTYLGGNEDDRGYGIAVDDSGNAYITGETSSTNFPTQNPYQTDPSPEPYYDAFVTKLSSSGDSLVYSTYLGGNVVQAGMHIAVDSSGNSYVTGYTLSTDFPIQNPYQAYKDSSIYPDAFVTKFSPSGNSLVYSTYLGGNGYEIGYGIAVDGSGNAYITGKTYSTDFPTQNPYQAYIDTAFFLRDDAFVTKFSPSGNSLVYSTYLGGDGTDEGFDIAVDDSGNAYITGGTYSTNFPIQDPYQTYQGPDEPLYGDAFVAKFSSSGNSLVYSTYLRGNDDDGGGGIAVDSSGNAYITGGTSSTNFPTQNPYQTDQGFYDVFVTKFGSGVPPHCSYIPGDVNGNGDANGIDVVYGVSFLKGGSAPPDSCDCPPITFPFYAAMDVNGDCSANGIDITYLVSYLKGVQPAILFCVDCPPAIMAVPGPVPAVMPVNSPAQKSQGISAPGD